MKRKYLDTLRDAWNTRKQSTLPPTNWLVAVVALGLIGYIVISIFLVLPGEGHDFNFKSEEGSITALSAICLSAAAAFSIASIALLLRNKDRRPLVLWTIMALGFGFLAFDELLEFHERVGYIISKVLPTGGFRNWNDILVILYGLAALPVVAILLPAILRYRMMIELFIAGFIFYAVHTGIDAVTVDRSIVSNIAEESCKLFAVASLSLGTFYGFLGALWAPPGDATRL